MKKYINEFVKQYLRLRMRRIERSMYEAEREQTRVLGDLLRRARGTEFGKQYGFDDIKNYHTFAQRVPVHDYEALKPQIARMMRGAPDVLWPGVINWYSKSSGTTSDKSKYIPVPPENLRTVHHAGAWDALALLYHHRPDLEIFRRKTLLLPGSYQHLPERHDTRFGDVSAVMVAQMPYITRPFCAFDRSVMLEPDFEKKLEQMALLVSKDPEIVMLSGAPTWIVVLFRRILEITGKANMLEVWPHLSVFLHGGMGFEPYRNLFRQFIPTDNFLYWDSYNASEGYFGTQLEPQGREMLLLTAGAVFYEFIPVEEWGKEHPQAVTIADVETDRTYALAISSNNGLWRYLPGDTLQFTGKTPPRFRITGRTQQFINTFGEELMVGDAEKALAETCKQTDSAVSEYTVAPVFMGEDTGKGSHEWVVEFGKLSVPTDHFARLLDTNLQRVNSDYEAKRFKGMALEALRLHSVPPGTFLRWMRQRGKIGGQAKVPRLANHRAYVEEVLRC